MKPDRRVGYNVRKKQILKLLNGRSMTPQEVAREVGITDSATRYLMRRYQVSGLLRRKGVELNPRRGRNPYVYILSDQGRVVLPKIRLRPRR